MNTMFNRITKSITFAAAHRLWGYEGNCQFVHGHNYKLEATVEGDVDENTGMVLDFSILKSALNSIKDKYDHTLILNSKDLLYIEWNNQNILPNLFSGSPKHS